MLILKIAISRIINNKNIWLILFFISGVFIVFLGRENIIDSIRKNDFFSSILASIIANLLWLLIGLIIGFISLIKIQKRNDFFGIKTRSNLRVYLPNLMIENNTILDRNKKLRKFGGAAIPVNSFEIMTYISWLFKPSLIEKISYGLTAKFIGEALIIYCESPPENINNIKEIIDIDDNKSISLLCIGGPVFNSVTSYYIERYSSYFKLIEESNSNDNGYQWVIQSTYGEKKTFKPEDDEDYGLLLRLKPSERNVSDTVIIAAGIGRNGTRAAGNFLLENWEQLWDTYKDKEFGICLKCKNYRVKTDGYKDSKVIEVKPKPNLLSFF